MAKKARKVRIDALMVERGVAPSLERAQAIILAGEVMLENVPVTSGAQMIRDDQQLIVRSSARFVSRGGIKLDYAIVEFGIALQGKICADVGAATGGFSDAMLQAGAEKVYAVDVGYGDLHWKVRSNPRVVPIERTNARYLEKLPEPVSFIAVDVSFISVTQILAVLKNWLDPSGSLIILVKPQFEASKDQMEEGGIIRNSETHRSVLNNVLTASQKEGYVIKGLVASPIQGAEGNVEFLLHIGVLGAEITTNIGELIDTVVSANGGSV